MNKQTLKNTLILLCITIISGLALGFVHELTKEPIAKQHELTREKACRQVFEAAASFDTEAQSDVSDYSKVLAADYDSCSIDEAVPALDENGSLLGYVVTATCSDGYGGDITLMVGITTDKTINGIEFLTLNETAGLGMNAKNPDFKNQFKDRTATELTVTQADTPADDEIQAISSATITSRAVTRAVNAASAYAGYLMEQKGGSGDE